MTSTSVEALARETLALCVAGCLPDELPPALIEDPRGDALFGILVEGLADRFEPALCDSYARLFAQAVAQVRPGISASAILARYERVRIVRPVTDQPRSVLVLSRVTLGADVAVTSVMLAAVKQCFPGADIVFVGPRKNYELFAGDPRIRHIELTYRRGSLRERLSLWDELERKLADTGALVIDPDSRLTQLGLLPVCPDDRYRLFESRAYGGSSTRTLPELAAAWVYETFGVAAAKPYVALAGAPRPGSHIAVSLGVGDNAAKRLPDPFEEELLRLLASTGAEIRVDRGAGGEEAARVTRAVERSGARVEFWDGSFAEFAAAIASAKLYVGYDSAGQHVAAACGVPLISIFAGFPAPRMFDRWRPSGPSATVIRVDRPDPEAALAQVHAALKRATDLRSGQPA